MSTKVAAAFSEDCADRRAIVVLGMHRSGTSAMTRTLSLLGAALPRRLMEAHSDNERGYWEPLKVAHLNDEILEALDSEWDDVFAFRPKQYLSNFDRVYLGRAVELLEEEFNGSELIVLKDPRISVLAPFWERALREAGYAIHYVVMVRNPLEVAESLRARDGFPREKSLLLWSSYMIAVDRDTRNASRTFVSYDQLMADWRGVRRRIEAGAGVPFPRDTSTAAIEIDRFLDPRLHHHAAAANDLISSADIPEQVKTLYRIFSGACEGAEVDAAALEAVRAEMEELDLLVGPLLADLRGATRALSAKVTEISSAHDEARERADRLQNQLLAERALRESEGAAASLSSADYRARVVEFEERISAIESERDRLAAEVEEKARNASELGARLALLEGERDRLATELDEKVRSASELGERFASIESERDRLAAEAQAASRNALELGGRLTSLEAQLASREAELKVAQESDVSTRAEAAANSDKLAEQLRETAKLTEIVRKSEREVDIARRDAEKARKEAQATVAANEEKLAQRYQEVATLTALLRKSEDEVERVQRAAEEARKNAESTVKESEGKLAQRYQEVATLTGLLRNQEQRSQDVEERVGWLLAFHEQSSAQPHWWSLMPRGWRRRRTRRYLQDAGLFDGAAYLRRHPDVASSGMDPLDHYLMHGLNEGRARNF